VLVLIACAIAIPCSIYLLHGWLQHFPYRTTVSWQLCTGAALGAVLLTLLTVSYQTLRAAVANPAKSLRTE
jgi:putative ABC transport system permease protein